MGVDALLVAAVLVAFLGYGLRAEFSLPVVFAAQSTFVAAGLIQTQSSGTAVYGAAVIAVLGGYTLTRRLSSTSSDQLQSAAIPTRAVGAVVAVAGVLAAYHLIKGGIPIFSGAVERQRFDFTASGLLGIPGRMFLFGTTFAWILSTANACARGVKLHRDRTVRWATAFLLVPGALSGFKGSLIYIVVTMAVIGAILSGRPISLGRLGIRYWPVAALLLANFFLVASLYSTVQASGQAPIELLANRLTVIAAEPVAAALSGDLPSWTPSRPLLSDFSYFLEKYFGIGQSVGYTYENVVSAYLIGVTPFSGTFLVPVTVGGIAESYAMGGTIFAVAVSGLSGAVMARLERPAKTALRRTVRLFAMLGIFYWLVRGGLAYYVINYTAVAMMMVFVALVVGGKRLSDEPGEKLSDSASSSDEVLG